LSLTVVGKISFQDCKCLKCDNIIRMYNLNPNFAKCVQCGALYVLIGKQIDDGYKTVSFDYDFIGFECINSGINICSNLCPSSFMYCQKHSSSEVIEKIKDDIDYNTKRIKDLEQKLEQVEESKKTWLINEMAGIGESDEQSNDGFEDGSQNNIIPKNQIK